MSGISCCCSLPSNACKTCPNLHPELEDTNKQVNEQPSLYIPTGWICPVCGCGMSPYIQQCNCQMKAYSSSSFL